MIEVKFFASIREQLGCAQLCLSLPRDGACVADVLQAVEAQTGVHLGGQHLLAAVNMAHVAMTAPVSDGDEVAFFPPVTGG
ncbi:molybdopterin converting factor subunit 1 [Acidithiobacillus sulfuriphilus]|uniref:Molybdopterin synthase sulfur carrier subunit n=2 Tax=Acidithiobacillus sulfuriphilus TaxID=1867749 RepID=A0A3M8RH29_9PROT|nr:molybdopterin converting factor subunit 1 [Acidithiobacillus sulfuriphilus]MCL5980821.1 molybdopterin converting factor subunit 1 [Gammaproteobacteria bacterium]RNF67958.1 molybdopterin converting factor subunit 1 [Acidithiobacillus sulfuriphilus]